MQAGSTSRKRKPADDGAVSRPRKRKPADDSVPADQDDDDEDQMESLTPHLRTSVRAKTITSAVDLQTKKDEDRKKDEVEMARPNTGARLQNEIARLQHDNYAFRNQIQRLEHDSSTSSDVNIIHLYLTLQAMRELTLPQSDITQ